jgi:hypothetical protein
MKKSLQRIVGSLSILALFLCLFIRPHSLHAHAEPTTSVSPVASVTSYVFSAGPGDSLSKIVRRALQLRAVTDQPTAMYCENTISTQLGGDYIEVSQQIVVSYRQIDDCTASAKSLTPDQQVAWQAYADTVEFNVDDISPTNSSPVVVAPQSPVNPPEEPSPEPTPTPVTEPSKPANPAPKTTKPIKKVSATAWLIVGSIATMVAFIAGESFAARRTRR